MGLDSIINKVVENLVLEQVASALAVKSRKGATSPRLSLVGLLRCGLGLLSEVIRVGRVSMFSLGRTTSRLVALHSVDVNNRLLGGQGLIVEVNIIVGQHVGVVAATALLHRGFCLGLLHANQSVSRF